MPSNSCWMVQLEAVRLPGHKEPVWKRLWNLKKGNDEISSLDFNLSEYMTSALEIVEEPRNRDRADLKAKQQLIGSVCLKELIFENKSLSDNRVNRSACPDTSADKGFNGSKRLAPVLGANPIRCKNWIRTLFYPCRRCDLNTVRLPISPSGHTW